jgi:multiple sugar transport system substrate-binding protein
MAHVPQTLVTSRRRFLRLAAFAGVGGSALLSACGGGASAVASTTGTTASLAATTTAATTATPSTAATTSAATSSVAPSTAATSATAVTSAASATTAATTASSSSSAATASQAAASTSSAAAPTPTAIPVKQGQTRIEFLSWYSEDDADKTGINAIDQIIKDFEAKNPNIVVQNIYGGHDAVLVQKVLTLIAGGTPPQTYYADRFGTATYAHKGIYTDLTPLNSKAGITADTYLDFAWKEATWQGKQWALPFNTDCRMLYVNMDAARAAGANTAKLPQTTQDLMDWTQSLTKTAANGQITQLGFWPMHDQASLGIWMVNFGGKFWDDAAQKCVANDANDIDALTYMQTYAKRWGQKNVDNFFSAQPKGADQNPFYTGRLVADINTDGTVASIARYKPDLNYSLVPIPGKDGPGSSLAGGWSVTIPTGAKPLDEAYTWASYLAGEGQLVYCVQTTHIPTFKAILNDPKLHADPKHAQFYTQLNKAWSRPAIIEGQRLWDDIGQAQSKVMNMTQEPKPALDFIVQDVNTHFQMDNAQ